MFAECYCQPGTGKTPHLGTQIWQICTLPGSLVRVRPQPGSVDEQGPLVGMTLRALPGGSSSAKSLVLVVVSPSPTLPQSFSPGDGALTFPCNPRGRGLEWGGSYRVTHNAGCSLSLLSSPFPLETSPCVALAWGWGSVVNR